MSQLIEFCKSNNVRSVIQYLNTLKEPQIKQAKEDVLYLAITHNSEEIINACLTELQVNVNCKNSRGETPLVYAMSCKRFNLIKHLIENFDADIEITDEGGNNCLLYAALLGEFDLMKYLIVERKANIDVQNKAGEDIVDSICKFYYNRFDKEEERISWIEYINEFRMKENSQHFDRKNQSKSTTFLRTEIIMVFVLLVISLSFLVMYR